MNLTSVRRAFRRKKAKRNEEKRVLNCKNATIPLHGAQVTTPKLMPTDFEPQITHTRSKADVR